MSAEEKFKVIRSHYGDKAYKVGDTRTARRQDVKHLLGTSLEDPNPAKEEKPKAKPKAKAAPKAKPKAKTAAKK